MAAQLEDHFGDGHGDEDHRGEVEQQVRDSLKQQLVLDKIAETEQLSVSEQELSAWLVQQAPRYGMSPDQFAQELVQAGQVPSAVAEVRRSKALAHVMELATITDTDGNVVDLAALARPDFAGLAGSDFEFDDSDDSDDSDEHAGHDHA